MRTEFYKLDEIIQDHDKLTALRRLCLADLSYYIALMFFNLQGAKFDFKPFHYAIIKELETYAFCKNDKKNLVINCPVGSGKSTLIEFFITWCFARSKNSKFCYVSHSDDLITKLSGETKIIIESKLYQTLFNLKLKVNEKSKTEYSFLGSSLRSGLTAGSIGSAMTGADAGNPNVKEGEFPGALIIDDPLDVKKITSETARKESIRAYTDKLEPRLRNSNVPIIVIMQRLHQEDLSGYILKNDLENTKHVKVQALQNDKSYWEEKISTEKLKKTEIVNPFLFNSQYQQEPIVLGGTVIKKDWIHYYRQIPEDIIQYCIFADTAQKTNEWNDFSVIQVWGKGKSGKIYFLFQERGKWEAPELDRRVKAFHKKCVLIFKVNVVMYIEDKSSGTGLIQNISNEIPVIAVQREKDKYTRVQDTLIYFETGFILFPHPDIYPETDVIVSECLSFSADMSHTHDDQVDCICDAVDVLILGNNNMPTGSYA